MRNMRIVTLLTPRGVRTASDVRPQAACTKRAEEMWFEKKRQACRIKAWTTSYWKKRTSKATQMDHPSCFIWDDRTTARLVLDSKEKCTVFLSFLDIQRSFSRRVNAFMGNDTVPEHSPVGGHQRNSAVERCVRTVSEQFGMLHDHIEAKIAATIDRRNPLFQWLFPGSANLIARCSDEGLKAITGEVVHRDSEAEK